MSAVAASKTKAKQSNAFAGISDILGGGFDSVLSTSDHMIRIDPDDIEIREQVREEFEDEENSLDELGESLRTRQLQNIVVRPNPGGLKPYLLVIGERRVRSAKAKGPKDLWALVSDMSDEEAEEAQLAENIQRKNLTQLEEAKRIQRDLDKLGGVEAVLAKHKKSRAWLSKRMSLLRLPEQAKRLLKENISADLEVINSVKVIEHADPEKAKGLVDDLKRHRGKVDARAATAAVKDQVKPPKKDRLQTGGAVATVRDRSQEAPSQSRVFASAKTSEPALPPAHEDSLQRAYIAIFEAGKQPKAVLDGLADVDRDAIEAFLHTFYMAGRQATDAARIVIDGFRRGGFATDGVGAFALVAYLHGTDSKARFDVLNVFGCLKP